MARRDFPHSFRMKLWPWLIFGWVGMHLGVALFVGVAMALNPPNRVPLWVVLSAYAYGSAVGAVVVAVGMLGYVTWFRVRVGPAGLRGYDFWSLPMTVRWEAVAHLRPFSLAGLPYL